MKSDWSDMSQEMIERIEIVRDGLTKKTTGEMSQGIENCVIVLENDPLFKGAICSNLMTGRIDIAKNLGWYRDPVYLSITDDDFLDRRKPIKIPMISFQRTDQDSAYSSVQQISSVFYLLTVPGTGASIQS